MSTMDTIGLGGHQEAGPKGKVGLDSGNIRLDVGGKSRTPTGARLEAGKQVEPGTAVAWKK